MSYLSYKKIGKGRPFVLVHGYLGGQNMWKFQEELKNDFELIMPSLAGYGESAEMTAPSTICLLYTSPSPRDRQKSRMPSSA